MDEKFDLLWRSEITQIGVTKKWKKSLPMESWPSDVFSSHRWNIEGECYEVMLTEKSGVAHAGKIWKMYPPDTDIVEWVTSIAHKLAPVLTPDLAEDLQRVVSFSWLWIVEDQFDKDHAARREFWGNNPSIDLYCKWISKMRWNTLINLAQGVEFFKEELSSSLTLSDHNDLMREASNLMHLWRNAQDYQTKSFSDKVKFLQQLDLEIYIFIRYLQKAFTPQ